MAPSLAEQLDAWKQVAQAVSEPIVTEWIFNGAALLMHPNGAGGGQWLLKTPDITLYLSGGMASGTGSHRCASIHNTLLALYARLFYAPGSCIVVGTQLALSPTPDKPVQEWSG